MNHLIGRIFSRIWMFLRRDFWRKLIALCFAFFTYFAVQAQLAGEQKLTGVPVEIRLPPELISVGRQDFLVSVTARGPKSSLRNFEGRDLKGVVEVRLEDYGCRSKCGFTPRISVRSRVSASIRSIRSMGSWC